MKLSEALGVALRQYRNNKEMSQIDVAAIADMERSSVSAIENGRHNISMQNFIRLCDAMEADPKKVFETALEKMGR